MAAVLVETGFMTNVEELTRLCDETYQQKLMENCDGVITTSSSTCYKSVYNGEYAVGLTYDNGAIGLLMSGAETSGHPPRRGYG